MTSGRNLVIIAAALLLAACASPTVDSSAPAFDETKYAVDLDNCRGGTVLDVALNGLGVAVIGSAYGLLQGASTGAITGRTPEGAIVGVIVGGVAGAVVGAYEPIQEQEQSVARCLSGKGYVLGS
jgi:outer membrane lipoprotein SlyB